MTITYLGSLSVGASVPGAESAVSAGISGVSGALPHLEAQIAALVAFKPSPVDFTAQLTLANNIVASVALGIAAGLPVPDDLAQRLIISAQLAALNAQLGTVKANLDILVALNAPLLATGVHGYAYDGAVGAFGGELSTELAGGVPGGSGGGEHSNAVMYITTVPAAWDAMAAIFKVSP